MAKVTKKLSLIAGGITGLFSIMLFQNFTTVQATKSAVTAKQITKVRIGILPVIEADRDIDPSKYEMCYTKSVAPGQEGQHVLFGITRLGSCANIKNSSYQAHGGLGIPLIHLLYNYGNSVAVVKDAHIKGVMYPYQKEDLNLQPLRFSGDYLMNLLKRHGISKTRLGDNLNIETVVQKAINFRSRYSNQNEWVNYLEDAMNVGGIDRSKFDYVVPVHIRFLCNSVVGNNKPTTYPFADNEQLGCIKDSDNKGSRSTISSAKKAAYIEANIFLTTNNAVTSIVHELTHLLLGLGDTYTSDSTIFQPYLKYPEGIPDSKINGDKYCLMAGMMPKAGEKPFVRNGITVIRGEKYVEPLWRKKKFQYYDVTNTDLCPHDIARLKELAK